MLLQQTVYPGGAPAAVVARQRALQRGAQFGGFTGRCGCHEVVDARAVGYGDDLDGAGAGRQFGKPCSQGRNQYVPGFLAGLVQAHHQGALQGFQQLQGFPHRQVRVLLLAHHQHDHIGDRGDFQYAALVAVRPEGIEVGRIPDHRAGSHAGRVAGEAAQGVTVEFVAAQVRARRGVPSRGKRARSMPVRLLRRERESLWMDGETRQRAYLRRAPAEQQVDDGALADLGRSHHGHLRRTCARSVDHGEVAKRRLGQLQCRQATGQFIGAQCRGRIAVALGQSGDDPPQGLASRSGWRRSSFSAVVRVHSTLLCLMIVETSVRLQIGNDAG